MLRVFTYRWVAVKPSDFGFAKQCNSDFEKTESGARGTIVDLTIERFKDFVFVNDIYVVGFVLFCIFRES